MYIEEYPTATLLYRELHSRFPESRRVAVDLITASQKSGDIALTLDLLEALLTVTPHETWVISRYLTIRFNLGDYGGVLTRLENEKRGDAALQLLHARALYGLQRYDEAFVLYQSLLTPSAEELFNEQLAATDAGSQRSARKGSIFPVFGRSGVSQLELVSELGGEAGLLASRGTAASVAGAELFARYAMQQQIDNEFLARKALADNKYLVAERQYRQSDQRPKSAEGLKDLAKIYERLGRYDQQAEIYSRLKNQVEPSPELEESIARNRIATAPTLGLVYGLEEKNGRRGFFNMRRQSVGIDFQYLPTINSSLALQYHEVSYEPAEGEGDDVDGRRFVAAGEYRHNDRASFLYELGLHMLDSDSDSSFFSRLGASYLFGPGLSGYLEYRQELVEDNFTTLDDGMVSQNLLGGMVFENPLGITVGGEYRRLWYEDDNFQNRINVWTGYTLYKELTSYSLEYRFEQLGNDKGDVEAGLDYWSPKNFWRHQLTGSVEYLIKNTDEEGRPPSTVSANLVVGYEEEQDFTLGGGADIFLEIGSNFLVKGSVFYTEGDDYREERGALSLVYRW